MDSARSSPQRIVVADGQPIFKEAMLRIVRSIFPQATLYVASDLESLMARREIDPELIVLDFLCPDYDPVFSARWLRGEFPHSAIIFVSSLDDRRMIGNVVANGADGHIGKSATSEEIAEALQAIMAGAPVGRRTEPSSRNRGELTSRQREILDLMAEGRSNKEIGRALNISPFTVRIHVSAVLRFLEVETRAAAVAKAISTGLYPRF